MVISPDEDNHTVGGLMLDTDERRYHHLAVSGTVIAVPDKLIYHGREADTIRRKGRIRSRRDQIKLGHYNQYGTAFDVPVEIRLGDKVMYKHLAVEGAPVKGVNVPIPYEMLILKFGGEIYPLNGHVLVEPFEKEVFGEPKELKGYGTVAHLGCKVKHYRDYPSCKDGDVSVGDFIMFHKSYTVPVEIELHRKLDKRYFYIHRRNILAIGSDFLVG